MNKENRIWRHQSYWRTYFEMRRQQLETVQHMLVELAFVYEKLPQGDLVADVFDQLADDVRSDVYEGNSERKLRNLEKIFRGMALPESREEFEIRAALLALCRELERFLSIAKRLKKKKQMDKSK
jgi:uncharacterized membrane protein YgaE (UPF0421/DUF939 family)